MAMNRQQLESMPTQDLEQMATGMEGQMAEMEGQMADMQMPVEVIGEFSETKLNSLVDALNGVLLELPGVPEYPTFQGDLEMFPPEFVDAINLVNDVASDVGHDDMVIDVTVIGDDKDLTKAAGQLKSLAKSREFKQLLKSLPGETDLAEPTTTEPPPPTDVEMDEMMMMRM